MPIAGEEAGAEAGLSRGITGKAGQHNVGVGHLCDHDHHRRAEARTRRRCPRARPGGPGESREQREDEGYASPHALVEPLSVSGHAGRLYGPPVRADMGIMKWRFVSSQARCAREDLALAGGARRAPLDCVCLLAQLLLGTWSRTPTGWDLVRRPSPIRHPDWNELDQLAGPTA